MLLRPALKLSMFVMMVLMLMVMATAFAVLIMVMMVLVIVVMATALAVLIVVMMMVLVIMVMAAAFAVLIMVMMMVLMIVVMAAALAILFMLAAEFGQFAQLSNQIADESHHAFFNLMEVNAENDIGGTDFNGAVRLGAVLAALNLYGCANGGYHNRLILAPGYKALDVADENIVLISPAVGFLHSGYHCGNKLIRSVGSGKLNIKISGDYASFIVKSCAYIYMYHVQVPLMFKLSREWVSTRQDRWACCPR